MQNPDAQQQIQDMIAQEMQRRMTHGQMMYPAQMAPRQTYPGHQPHGQPPFMANNQPMTPYGMPMGAPRNDMTQNNLNMQLGPQFLPTEEVPMFEVDIKGAENYGAKQK